MEWTEDIPPDRSQIAHVSETRGEVAMERQPDAAQDRIPSLPRALSFSSKLSASKRSLL